MDFALLGDDPACLPLIGAIAAHPEHRLALAAQAGALLGEVLATAPDVRAADTWGELLSERSLEAVIVAGHGESVLEGAVRLAQDGRSLLVVPDARQGLEFVYRLSLIRDEKGVVLFPLFAERCRPEVRRLCEMLAEERLGKLLHLQLEREIADESGRSPPLLTTTQIDRALLADVDLLRLLGGEYNEVTAVHTGIVGQQVAMAHVAFGGEGLPAAAWSAKATAGAPRWKLMSIGEKGTVVLSRDALGLHLQSDDVDLARETAGEGDDLGQCLLAQFQAVARSQAIPNSRTAEASPPGSSPASPAAGGLPTWGDLTREFELVHAARRSIRRRRTIDVHFETTSERSLFKGQMATLGCGVLLATLFLVIVVLTIGSVFEPPKPLMHVLRVLAFLPLLLFLLLQLLYFIARPAAEESRRR